MTLSELVPPLDLCQQLKAAGFPQDTAMVWLELRNGQFPPYKWVYHVWQRGDVGGLTYNPTVVCAAPTAGELEEWLIGRGTIEYIMSAESEVGISYSPDKRVNNCRNVRAYTLVAALAALVLEVAG